MKLAITGGAGFIGSNFVHYILGKYPSYSVLNLDKLAYSGNLENLAGILGSPRHRFLRIDICDRKKLIEAFSQTVDAVVHFAAESHVDRSILDASEFIKTNILGTQCVLDAARQAGVQRFLHVSTDEVYGSADNGDKFRENSLLAPNSPYAASKAASDLVVRAYYRTYRFPVIITRCSNNYGPYQFPEKLIPLLISRALENQSIPIYGDGLQVRDWIFVTDHCRALDAVLRHGREGEVYNIGAGNEQSNLEIARQILKRLGKSDSLLEYVQDRPGHDQRYSIGFEKIKSELGWAPEINWEDGLEMTINWYIANVEWGNRIRDHAYRSYYCEQYEQRDQTLARVLNPRRRSECATGS